MTVSKYMDSIKNQDLRDAALHLQKIILSASDTISEGIKWNVPTYTAHKNICSIMAHKNHINFQIFQGAHIADALDLEGTGKDMRHLKFKSVDDIKKSKAQKYLKQALELDK